MIAGVRRWWPPGLADRSVARELICEAINIWSARWFTKSSVAVANYRAVQGSARSSEGGDTWRAYGSALAAACSKRSAQRLAEIALDLRSPLSLLTEADRRLLDLYEPMLLSDLAQQVALAVDAGRGPVSASPTSVFDPFNGDGGALVDIVERQGGMLLTLAVPVGQIAALVLERTRPSRAVAEPLTPLLQAVGSTKLRLEASLGAAELALSDLEGLSVGDVLVLDAPLAAGVALTIAGSSEPIRRGKLAEVGGQTILNL